ncbi:uncharacterized protein LOC103975853 [Musa acuminata AAA Group]|uniref:uncharacterized protein LOC103975853 n=1 Tax=Musa acuminata AAA Group TaxID=214697 RepID=UPI0031D30FE4
MGLCLSKKKAVSPPRSTPTSCSAPSDKKVEKPSQRVVEATAEKKQVFVVAHNAKKSAAEDDKEKKRGETPTKKAGKEVETNGAGGVVVVPAVEEFRPVAAVRTSSCTKEEVDAILIQCGRLSRSSSGKASDETGIGHRKYSGSKRSYDFDNEKKGDEEEGEWGEKPASRPSPRRRTPSRERSGSRERGSGGGGRRVSRSPGRRSEVPASSGTPNERSKPPAKMVAVPAREKGRGVSPAASNKRGGEAGALRSASPRSRSPANTTPISNENAAYHVPPPNQPQSLSRSSSRKAEQSPFRRNPMAEIDENALRANQHASIDNKIQKTKEGEERIRKPSQSHTQKTSENNVRASKSSSQRNGAAAEFTSATRSNDVQVMSCRAKEQETEAAVAGEAIAKASSKVTESPNLGVESHILKTISGTRSSRDLDHPSELNQETFLNPNSYASSLLEDIHNYQQQLPKASFSLPACVSKACSILEAVADLNSASSENNGSLNGRHQRRGSASKVPFVESEIVVKDDLLEPSLHKYVTVRDMRRSDVEPQESAGSNSFMGQPWSSGWEPNSVDSTDHYQNSRSIDGEEVEEEEANQSPVSHGSRYHQQPVPEVVREPETRGRRSRGVSGNSSNHRSPAKSSKNSKRELHHRVQLHRTGSGDSGGGKPGSNRAYSAAGSSS